MLESLDQSNIKRMSVEHQESKQAPDFDFNEFFSEKDIPRINETITMSSSGHIWWDVDMIEIAERALPRFHYDISDKFSDIKKEIGQYKIRDSAWNGILQMTSFLKARDPNFSYEFSEVEEQRIRQEIEDWLSKHSRIGIAVLYYAEKLIHGFKYELTEQDLKAITQSIEAQLNNDIRDAIETLYMTKQARPDFDFQITPEIIEKAKKYIREKGDIKATLQVAADLKDLLKKGDDRFASNIPNLPEQRNF